MGKAAVATTRCCGAEALGTRAGKEKAKTKKEGTRGKGRETVGVAVDRARRFLKSNSAHTHLLTQPLCLKHPYC